MIQIALEDDELTWDSELLPTEPGLQHLPDYGGFAPTDKALLALGKVPFGRFKPTRGGRTARPDPQEEWPVDPPFEED